MEACDLCLRHEKRAMRRLPTIPAAFGSGWVCARCRTIYDDDKRILGHEKPGPCDDVESDLEIIRPRSLDELAAITASILGPTNCSDCSEYVRPGYCDACGRDRRM
jgi:hypothetical protein